MLVVQTVYMIYLRNFSWMSARRVWSGKWMGAGLHWFHAKLELSWCVAQDSFSRFQVVLFRVEAKGIWYFRL